MFEQVMRECYAARTVDKDWLADGGDSSSERLDADANRRRSTEIA